MCVSLLWADLTYLSTPLRSFSLPLSLSLCLPLLPTRGLTLFNISGVFYVFDFHFDQTVSCIKYCNNYELRLTKNVIKMS